MCCSPITQSSLQTPQLIFHIHHRPVDDGNIYICKVYYEYIIIKYYTINMYKILLIFKSFNISQESMESLSVCMIMPPLSIYKAIYLFFSFSRKQPIRRLLQICLLPYYIFYVYRLSVDIYMFTYSTLPNPTDLISLFDS